MNCYHGITQGDLPLYGPRQPWGGAAAKVATPR